MDLFGFEDEETIDNIQAIVPEKKIPASKPVQAEPRDEMSITQIQELLLAELNSTETTLNSTLGETSIYDEDPESVTPEPELIPRPRRAARLKNISHNEDSSVADETASEFVVPKSRPRKAVRWQKAVQDENKITTDSISEPPVLNSRPQRAARQKKMVLDADTSSMIETVPYLTNRATRAYTKPVHQKQPIREEIQNTYSSYDTVDTTATRAYTKPVRQKKPVLGEIQNTCFSDDAINTSVIKRKRDVVKKKTKAQNNAEIENEHVQQIAEEINQKFKQIENFKLLVE